MKYNTKEIITILRHCGNQGNACPCADCLLKDNAKGNECMEMYNVAADEIERLYKEIKADEQIIRDLTRAVCAKDDEIKKLGDSFAKHLLDVCYIKDRQITELLNENSKLKELLKKATSIEGFIDYHYDEIEEALKDENRAIQR